MLNPVVPTRPNTLTPADTGLYINPVMDKQGFDVFVQPNQTLFYQYTFDKDGLPIYYIGGGPDNSFKLYQTDGNKDESHVGEVTLTPTMVAAYTEEMGRVTVPIEPLFPLTTHSHDDAWVDEDYPAEGFTIHFWNNLCSCLWFTYKNGRPWWYVCPGIENGSGYDLSIIEIENARFMYGGGTEKKVGTATLDILGDNSIVVEGALGNDFNLHRLFN